MKKIYVGAGNDRRDGFIHTDVRALPGIDIICPAWELSSNIHNVDEIYSRHMLEHLTTMEADCALRDWYEALKVGGSIHVIVPDMDYHAQQWLSAEWSEDTLCNPKSDARHAFAGFWGWQDECNPNLKDYNTSYWDVHKSGYNKRRLEFLLGRIGFSNIEVYVEDNYHLHAVAKKTMDKGERQISSSLRLIRADHRNRYEFATRYLNSTDHVLDAACGIGYGSFILSKSCANVTGIDISEEAIDFANKHYNNTNINYSVLDLADISNLKGEYSAIVSFETFEHIDFTSLFLSDIVRLLKNNGYFIVSTPNQEKLPFNIERFPYHIKHYTNSEMTEALESAGLSVEEVWSQHDPIIGDVENDTEGLFLIYVAKKR